jgi:hypothetical protein
VAPFALSVHDEAKRSTITWCLHDPNPHIRLPEELVQYILNFLPYALTYRLTWYEPFTLGRVLRGISARLENEELEDVDMRVWERATSNTVRGFPEWEYVSKVEEYDPDPRAPTMRKAIEA